MSVADPLMLHLCKLFSSEGKTGLLLELLFSFSALMSDLITWPAFYQVDNENVWPGKSELITN